MAAPGFSGFPRAAFAWFAGLQADNDKAWFTAHRATYDEAVRGPMEALLEELADEHGGRVKLFRQHRDTRFSRDKSPYKTRTYGAILDRPDGLASLYAEVAVDGLFAGSGYYQLAADQLARFRAAVLDDAAGGALERVLADVRAAGVPTYGEALKTAPRGFPRDHPRVALLRHKSLIAGLRLAPDPAAGIPRDAALGHCRAVWATCAPMTAWLDEHVGASELPAPSRFTARA
jgi:uncharacterized protein (TIGR02453 family)